MLTRHSSSPRASALLASCSALVFAALVSMTPALADELYVIEGSDSGARYGEVLAPVPDLDDDLVPDFVLGVPRFDGAAGVDSGAIVAISGVDGSEIFTVEGLAAGDQFGTSVSALDGRILVGAPFVDIGKFVDAGRVYIVSRAGAIGLTFDGQAAFDEFGRTVAGIDANGDGDDDVVVGAPQFDSPSGPDSGRLYVYSGTDASLLYRVDGENLGDSFAWTVAGAGIIDGDTAHDIAVAGINVDTAGGTDAGRVYVLSGIDGTPIHTFDGTGASDNTGTALAGGADYTGDGVDDVIIGTEANDAAGPEAGRVIVLSGADGTVAATLDGPSDGSRYGHAVALIPDLDGDGFAEIAIGADTFAGPKGAGAGLIEVLGSLTGARILAWDGDTSNERNGSAVGPIGDVDSDGFVDFAMTAVLYDTTTPNVGRCYVHSGNPYLHCNKGNIDWDNGEYFDITDILYVNGRTGGPNRLVSVDEGEALWCAILEPPAGGPGKYVVHFNTGTPDFTTLVFNQRDIGTSCFNFILPTGGTPVAVYNQIGKEATIGASSYFDGSPIPNPPRASTVFLTLFDGDVTNLPAGTTLTVQAIMLDPGAVSSKGASVSNSVVLTIN